MAVERERAILYVQIAQKAFVLLLSIFTNFLVLIIPFQKQGKYSKDMPLLLWNYSFECSTIRILPEIYVLRSTVHSALQKFKAFNLGKSLHLGIVLCLSYVYWRKVFENRAKFCWRLKNHVFLGCCWFMIACGAVACVQTYNNL